MLYFAKSTLGFYDDHIHTPAQIPSDAVEITESTWAALLTAQANGSQIVSDATGHPIAAETRQ